jgi:hypothetical protein
MQPPLLILVTTSELLILLLTLHQVVMVAEFGTTKRWLEVVWCHTQGWILLVLMVPVVCQLMSQAFQVHLDVVTVFQCPSVQFMICLPQQLAQLRLIQLSAFTKRPQQQQQTLVHRGVATPATLTTLPACGTETSLENPDVKGRILSWTSVK